MGSWSSMLWKLKQETCISVPWLVLLLSYSIAIWLSFTQSYQPLINFWGQWGGSSNSCARRSLRCCPKANQNPSDTAVNCHFSHKFGKTIWYGGLLRTATEQSAYLLWSSYHCLSLSSLVCCHHLSLVEDGPGPLTHLICCFQNISLHRKFQIRHIKLQQELLL